MKQLITVILLLCLLLSGCGVFDGSYIHVEPHKAEGGQTNSGNVSASDYQELCEAVAAMAESGTPSGIIAVQAYDQSSLREDLGRAVEHTLQTSPIAAWAVENITWELGASGGKNAVAVDITYVHDRTEIRKIRRIKDVTTARSVMRTVLDDCGTGIVLLMQNYEETDFAQIVEDYAALSPQTVMETPEVVANIYPQEGTQRLIELKFSYQTSRDTLRSMQTQVQSVFDSSAMYVSGYSLESEKYEGLYSFLMDFLAEGDQPLKTSITPAYSLLRHGVGNEKAFATVYAAMCRQAGLTCQVISGTRDGVSWYWNLLCIDGVYSHLDLLRCSEEGKFSTRTDGQMGQYYWDYDIVP